MCATMTQTSPIDLAKRVAIPLVVSVSVVILASMVVF